MRYLQPLSNVRSYMINLVWLAQTLTWLENFVPHSCLPNPFFPEKHPYFLTKRFTSHTSFKRKLSNYTSETLPYSSRIIYIRYMYFSILIYLLSLHAPQKTADLAALFSTFFFIHLSQSLLQILCSHQVFFQILWST